jgi:hypothetical protein
MTHLQQAVTSRRKGKKDSNSTAIWLVFVALILVLAPAAWSQDNATITGTVTDASGAVVPNASISLTNVATGQVRQSVSNSVGAYRFASAGAGTYNLSATIQGYQKFNKTGIVANVAQTVEQDVVLTIGNQSQTVTVEANALSNNSRLTAAT